MDAERLKDRSGHGGAPTESPVPRERVMEEVVERENMKRALRRVRGNRGGPGVDGMTVEELPAYLREHWPVIRGQLLVGSYTPQPVKRVEIPKPGGGMRKLGIPTVLDRLIQQAVMQVLQKQWDPTFSEASFGFRPGRSAHQAVVWAQRHVAGGSTWVVDIDLEKFFDRVNHDVLMSRVARRVGDTRLLRLVRSYLQAGVMEGGLVSPAREGTPQGGPLSPLLSNLLLDELDRELEQRGHRFARYADDCNIYVASQKAGQRVMRSITRYLGTKLRLKVNTTKSAVARAGTRQFLGFCFTARRRRVSPEALRRLKQRVRELTRRTKSMRIEDMARRLARYLRGWLAYFGFAKTTTEFHHLDAWIRRRLRCVIWKQWKRSTTRYRNLRRLGLGHDLAYMTAGSNRGPWAMSRSKGLQIAIRNAYFDSLGLPLLEPLSGA